MKSEGICHDVLVFFLLGINKPLYQTFYMLNVKVCFITQLGVGLPDTVTLPVLLIS